MNIFKINLFTDIFFFKNYFGTKLYLSFFSSPNIKILVLMNMSVLEFYGYIGGYFLKKISIPKLFKINLFVFFLY